MSNPARLLIAALAGLMLAGIVHIVAVLTLPLLAERDAFARLARPGEPGHATLVATSGTDTWLPLPDPAVSMAACAYDLEDGPVRVSTQGGGLFQSLAVHTGVGILFTVTDRAAARGALEVVVMTRRQLEEAQAEDEEPSRDVRIVSPARKGLVVVRTLAGLPSQAAEAEAAARAVTCGPDQQGEAEKPSP